MSDITRDSYVAGLRQIADWFEAHPEVALPHDAETFNYFSAHTKEEMAKVVDALGSCKKVYGAAFEDSFEVRKNFSGITFRAIGYRSNICERVKVGTKLVPEVKLPAREEEVIPAHEEDVYQWDCTDALLGKARASETSEA